MNSEYRNHIVINALLDTLYCKRFGMTASKALYDQDIVLENEAQNIITGSQLLVQEFVI